MTSGQHGEDRQHLLQDTGADSAGLRSMVTNAAVKLPELDDFAEQLVATVRLSGRRANHVVGQFCPPSASTWFSNCARIGTHAADKGREQRLGSAPSSIRRNAELAGQCIDAADRQQFIYVQVFIPFVARANARREARVRRER